MKSAFVNGGTFVLDSGSIAGTVQLNGAVLAPGTIPSGISIILNAASTIPGPGLVTNNGTLTLINSSVAGPLTNTSLLQVPTDANNQTTTSTVSGSLTNSGMLRIVGVGRSTATLDVSGTLTNTSSGSSSEHVVELRARRLRQEGDFADIPIVLVSATHALPDAAHDLGVRAVLTKPFDMGMLLAIVDRLARPG